LCLHPPKGGFTRLNQISNWILIKTIRGRPYDAYFPRLEGVEIYRIGSQKAIKSIYFSNIKFKFPIGKLIGDLKPKKPSPANVGTHGD